LQMDVSFPSSSLLEGAGKNEDLPLSGGSGKRVEEIHLASPK
jgi:hypothetical protein